MKSVRESLDAFKTAHSLLWGTGMWKTMAVPILLTVLYFPVLITVCYFTSGWTSEWFLGWVPSMGWFDAWAEALLLIIFFLLYGFLGMLTYRAVILIFYSVVLEFVSENVELHLLGRKAEDGKKWHQIIVRIVAIIIITLVLSIGLMIGNLFFSGIPIIGWGIAFLLIIPLQMFLSGVGYIDPVLDRNGYGARESLGLLRKHYLTVVCFSILSTLFLFIPIAGWFIGPTYSVFAGAVLGIRFDQERKAAESEQPS